MRLRNFLFTTRLYKVEKKMAYSDKVIEHYENPQNIGSLDKTSDDVGTGLVGAPACGDVMKLQLKINSQGIIEDAKFKTFGCGSAIASSSLVTTMVKGKSIEYAVKITNSDIAKELSLPPVKIHCSVLAEDAVKAAINDWKVKNNVVDNDGLRDNTSKQTQENASDASSLL